MIDHVNHLRGSKSEEFVGQVSGPETAVGRGATVIGVSGSVQEPGRRGGGAPVGESVYPTASRMAEDDAVASYAVGLLHPVRTDEDALRAVEQYLLRVQTTLDPFGGRFLIHGAAPDDVEGSWPDDLVVIAFPTSGSASRWYHSAAYQHIVYLRTAAVDGSVALFTGVSPSHEPSDVLRAIAARSMT